MPECHWTNSPPPPAALPLRPAGAFTRMTLAHPRGPDGPHLPSPQACSIACNPNAFHTALRCPWHAPKQLGAAREQRLPSGREKAGLQSHGRAARLIVAKQQSLPACPSDRPPARPPACLPACGPACLFCLRHSCLLAPSSTAWLRPRCGSWHYQSARHHPCRLQLYQVAADALEETMTTPLPNRLH